MRFHYVFVMLCVCVCVCLISSYGVIEVHTASVLTSGEENVKKICLLFSCSDPFKRFSMKRRHSPCIIGLMFVV